MKKLLLLVCIGFASCGAKSNEDLAKDLIKERLKATLPDFNSYESIDFSSMGKAFLSFEETSGYLKGSKELKSFKDSAVSLQAKETTGKTDIAEKETIRELLDSVRVKDSIISSAKRSYQPEKLFKITHSYKAKDKAGIVNTYKEVYYFDENFKGIVKENNVN